MQLIRQRTQRHTLDMRDVRSALARTPCGTRHLERVRWRFGICHRGCKFLPCTGRQHQAALPYVSFTSLTASQGALLCSRLDIFDRVLISCSLAIPISQPTSPSLPETPLEGQSRMGGDMQTFETALLHPSAERRNALRITQNDPVTCTPSYPVAGLACSTYRKALTINP